MNDTLSNALPCNGHPLLPCPFCGGVPHMRNNDGAASMDSDAGAHWIECAKCGASTNLRFSLMEDCRPLLVEQWNRRAQAAPSAAAGEQTTNRSQIITLCGSARFERLFKAWNEALTMAGHTVFSLTAYPSDKAGVKLWYTEEQKTALDAAHLRKINASDAIFVLNLHAYIGESTLREVEYARKLGKTVYFLESWGIGFGIGGAHTDAAQRAVEADGLTLPTASPIDTTTRTGAKDPWGSRLLGPAGTLRSAIVDLTKRAALATPPAASPAKPWDACDIKQPGWNHVAGAFVEGAREARANPEADDALFKRAADGYTKRVFEEVDPESERRLRTGDFAASPVVQQGEAVDWAKLKSLGWQRVICSACGESAMAAPVAPEAAPCPDCSGSGVDGDAGDDGRTIDVQCGRCSGSGKAIHATLPWPWKTEQEVLLDASKYLQHQPRLAEAVRILAARAEAAPAADAREQEMSSDMNQSDLEYALAALHAIAGNEEVIDGCVEKIGDIRRARSRATEAYRRLARSEKVWAAALQSAQKGGSNG